MWMQNLSVRKRMLVSNFLMIFIPVLLILLIGAIVVVGLRLTGNARQAEIALLWPESGPALSIQLAVSSLRVQVDHPRGPKMHELLAACHSLEEQGIQVVILQGQDVFYATTGSDAGSVMNTLQEKYRSGSVFLWDEHGFAFRYESGRRPMTVMAIGDTPFLAHGGILESTLKDVLETIAVAVIGITILIIVAIGVFLSRRLARQIVVPLEQLRQAAVEISRGNLDYVVASEGSDELGIACREFDQMRRQLKLARDTQQKYEKNRKELIAGISHDLSTPLTSVKGYASGLIDGIARTPPQKRHYLDMIYQTACSMENLVESLFLFSKLDLGCMPFHLEPVRLDAYFFDYVAENRVALQAKGLRVELAVHCTNCWVAIDRLQFKRLVENLVENSLKYKCGSEGRLVITLRDGPENCLQMKFSDDGVGVAATELSKLFESFYRTDPARANVSKGSGLGLAIVWQIVTALQGQVWAEPSEERGLTICILLPLAEEEAT